MSKLCSSLGGLKSILCTITELLGYVIPILIALGVIYFIWGVVQYVIGDGEEAKIKGRNHMIFGIIGLAVIIAMWGLVAIVTNTFGLTGYSAGTFSPEIEGLLP